MILSFTKDAAKLFKMESLLKTAHSERFKDSPPLDDWVIDVMFSNKHLTGVFLVHRHSSLTLFAISDKKDLTYCLNLLFGQLVRLLEELGFTDDKYKECIDNLTSELISVRHNNPSVSNEIGTIKDHFDWYNEQTMSEGKKFVSFEFMDLLNSKPKKKYDFKRIIAVFKELFSKHYNDPVLISDEHPSFKEHERVTFH